MNELIIKRNEPASTAALHLSRIRIFGLYLHSQILLLLVLEIFLSAMVVYIAGSYLDSGLSSFDFDLHTYGKMFSVPLVLSLSMAGVGLYSSRQPRNFTAVTVRFAVAVLLSFVFFSVFSWLAPAMILNFKQCLLLTSVSLLGLAIIRACFYRIFNQAIFERRVLVLGAGQRARSVLNLTNPDDQSAFDLVGFYSLENATEFSAAPAMLFNQSNGLSDIVANNKINEIVIALDDRRQQLPSDELLECKMAGIAVVDLLDFLERETGKIHFDLLNPSWLFSANGFNRFFFSNFLKRSFDIVGSLVLFVATAPVFVLTALLIWLEAKGKAPIFYRQERVGLDGNVFQILKFRSMRVDAESDGKAQWAQEMDPRVTAVGGVIRKYRIDELPQLLNVICGQMSLVGPRPERPEIVAKLRKLNRYYHYRHRVKPGLTGWAQLRFQYGATEASAIEKLQYDVYYLKNSGVLFDLYILIQTVEVVLFRKGAR